MFTTAAPSPRCGAAAWVASSVPATSTSKASRNRSAVRCSNESTTHSDAALLINASIPPQRSTAVAIRRSTSAGTVTSVGTAMPPTSRAAASRVSASRAAMTTVRPEAARRWAMPSPSPRLAPVTMVAFMLWADPAMREDPTLDPRSARRSAPPMSQTAPINAFDALVAPHRAELQRHCYRMLGSPQDAEDAVQETLLRAWRALPAFEGRSSARTWLYRIATNTCVTMIQRNPKRVLRLDGHAPGDPSAPPEPPLSESVWIAPLPDQPEHRYEDKEAIELAFVAALQHLTARQRAVLVLREVLGFTGAETADMLDTNADAVYSLLQRAHQAIDDKLPAISQQEIARSLGDEHLRAIADRFVAAWEQSDADALAALLAEDALLTMPPRPTWFRGRDAIRAFVAREPMRPGRRWRLTPTTVNGQLAFDSRIGDEARTHALQVITLRPDGRVSEITTFLAD